MVKEVEEVVVVEEVAIVVVVDAETTIEMVDLLVQIGTTAAETVQIHTDLERTIMYLKVIGWRTFFVFLLMLVWKLLS